MQDRWLGHAPPTIGVFRIVAVNPFPIALIDKATMSDELEAAGISVEGKRPNDRSAGKLIARLHASREWAVILRFEKSPIRIRLISKEHLIGRTSRVFLGQPTQCVPRARSKQVRTPFLGLVVIVQSRRLFYRAQVLIGFGVGTRQGRA